MRLEDWKDQVEVIQDEFEQCLTEKDGPLLEYDDEALSRLYNFYDETLLLLEEGVESLVVAPAKQLVDALSRLLDTVKVHLLENANDAIIEKIKKKRFEDSAAILKDRFELLDSLLSRGTIAYENEEPHTPTLRNLGILDGSFRDTCRLYFEKALRKGLQMMGFQDDDPDMNDIAFCVTKAWEIEFEMYNRFQVNCGDNIISPEYRDKARTIRWGLEDSSSPKLCLQVLLGEIEPAEFVNMSDEQILGNTHDNESSEAEEVEDVETQNDTGDADLSGIERQEQSITHAVDEIDPASGIKVGLGETAPDEGGNVDDRKRAPETSRSEVNLEDAVSDTAVSDTAKQLYAIAQSQQSAIESAVESQKTKDAVSNSKEESADSIYEDLDLAPATGSLSDKGGGGEKDEGSQQMVEVSSTRPDAPPSLAASVVYPSSGGIHKSSKKKSSGKASKRGKFVTNASGEESFQFSVCKPTVKFTARFYNENEAHASLCGILPDSISEKGRLRVDEFLKFLSGKLKGGRWVAIPMRLSIYSEEDAKKHKKFYKEYEANKRIAMFSIGENTKVFFVTPKFHRAAAKVIGSSFNVETSTYAVVLTKEKLSKGHSK